MEKYVFDKSKLLNRKKGLSAFVRLKNGGDTIEITIESHINIFDEIVILYNDCSDDSVLICEELRDRYPNKIKIYEYEPKVFPFGSTEHKLEPCNSVHSFVNFSNYALQLTTYETVMKLDDDHYCPKIYQSRDMFLKGFKHGRINFFSGVNLAKKKNEIGISSLYPFVGNGDHFIFDVTDETYFTKNDICEEFHFGSIKFHYIGLRYFHLKYLRSDFGFHNVLSTEKGMCLFNEISNQYVYSTNEFLDKLKTHKILYGDKNDKNSKNVIILYLMRFKLFRLIFTKKLIIARINSAYFEFRDIIFSDNLFTISRKYL
ncbi:hypothetical protein PDY_07140 [Photobacterium damselae subsp. damselae]|uniref:hypothetical protein n=1 Tax=Photobacterium damselae TaxID=38293 RepID=UPI002209C334|nr:hypothetical protein [Photobacterium damselae]BDR33666.1 hypothetical protein PDY_07140 [Photobacterium damselae subsp. damselae]